MRYTRSINTVIKHPFHAFIAVIVVFLGYWFLPKLKPEWSFRKVRFVTFLAGVLVLFLLDILFPGVE